MVDTTFMNNNSNLVLTSPVNRWTNSVTDVLGTIFDVVVVAKKEYKKALGQVPKFKVLSKAGSWYGS